MSFMLFSVVLNLFAAIPGVEHVVVIGVDGLSPQGIERGNTPVIDGLIRDGASTMKGRGVLPTSSSPNWASMLMGADPEQHGITSNDWIPLNPEIPPRGTGPAGIFPTIFSVLREQKPDAYIAAVYQWVGFGRLFDPKSPDFRGAPGDEEQTTECAIKQITEHKPQLLVVHLDLVDHALHSDGFCSPGYLAAAEKADGLVGRMVEAIKSAGISEKTVVIVLSDHGGKDTQHGGSTIQELEIPWIICGPGVARGRQLETHVNIYDTAATIAHIYGVRAPDVWTGKPVVEAFE